MGGRGWKDRALVRELESRAGARGVRWLGYVGESRPRRALSGCRTSSRSHRRSKASGSRSSRRWRAGFRSLRRTSRRCARSVGTRLGSSRRGIMLRSRAPSARSSRTRRRFASEARQGSSARGGSPGTRPRRRSGTGPARRSRPAFALAAPSRRRRSSADAPPTARPGAAHAHNLGVDAPRGRRLRRHVRVTPPRSTTRSSQRWGSLRPPEAQEARDRSGPRLAPDAAPGRLPHPRGARAPRSRDARTDPDDARPLGPLPHDATRALGLAVHSLAGDLRRRRPPNVATRADIDLFVITAAGHAYTAYTLLFLATSSRAPGRSSARTTSSTSASSPSPTTATSSPRTSSRPARPYSGQPAYEALCAANEGWVREPQCDRHERLQLGDRKFRSDGQSGVFGNGGEFHVQSFGVRAE